MDQPLALGVAEVARLLSCSKAHVYNLIERGELPTVPHMGARKLVPRQAVEDLVAGAAHPQHVRCTPCWMGAHRQCEGGACTCTDETHNENEGPGVRPEPLEEHGRLTAADRR